MYKNETIIANANKVIAEDLKLAEYEQVNREHEILVQNLFKPTDPKDMLNHGTLGVVGEAGELADAIKKHIYYERPLDIENVIEELGDLLFYVEGIAQLLGLKMEHLKAHNIKKLRTRYHKGVYSNEQASERADKK